MTVSKINQIGRALLVGLALAIAPLCAYARSASTSASDLPKIYQKLPASAGLIEQITAALTRVERVGSIDNAPIPYLDEFARLILKTSSVEWSDDRRYAVLYSLFSDLFTVIQFDGKGLPTAVFLAMGENLGATVSGGKVPEENDVILRMFRQRPKLQRDLAFLLGKDERGILEALSGLQKDSRATKLVAVGLLMQVKGMEAYNSAVCRDSVEAYRQSETFFLRFPRGRSEGDSMKPQGLVSIDNKDNFVLQDDQLARETAFLEVSDGPSCQIKKVRLFFAY